MNEVDQNDRARRQRARYRRQLTRLGFDQSWYNRSTQAWRLACSQCVALFVNGTPTHEHGCPNASYAKLAGRGRRWT
jgi:hypothetical protein